MYMMFVDESGDPGYPKDGDWSKWGGSTHFARVGVVLHGLKWRTWNEKLVSFKRNRGLTWDSEIKASDLRQGRGAFAGWAKDRRDFFLKDLVDRISGAEELTLLGVVIEKKKVDLTRKPRLIKPEVRSLELLLEMYNSFLDEQRFKAGVVVLDPTKEQNDDNLRYFQSFLQAHSGNLQPLRIVESTFFAKSHTSNLIQVSDVCTNLLYRFEARGANRAEYKMLEKRFWKRNGRIKGIGLRTWP